MRWDNIPQELKSNGLWCCWRLTEQGKVPFNALTGQLAKSNNPNSFTTFSKVLEKLNSYLGFNDKGQMTGGLGLGIFNGFSAIDIDHCRNAETGELSDLAQEIIDYCESYTESSPSGTGIRIIFKTDATIDKNVYYSNNRKLGLEVYVSGSTNKFVTITGNNLNAYDISSVDILYLMNKFMRKTGVLAGELKEYNPPRVSIDLKTALSKDKKLNSLWNGTAPGPGANESELDLALCNKLAFYLNSDYNAINEAFMQSPYYNSKDSEHKKKWNERLYRDLTINSSIDAIKISFQVRESHDEFELTDTGNAHRFIEKFGEQIKFNVDNQKWMIWNGKYWQPDVFNNIKNFAETMLEDMKQQALIMPEGQSKQDALRNVKRALSSAGKQAFLKEAEHLAMIPCTNDQFDNDPFLLNTESGVVNLKTSEILPFNKGLMLSKFIYSKVSPLPPKRWLKFLDEVFANNKELIRYIQKIFGYALTGSTREQAMFIFLGEGSNGKSLLLEILNKISGSYGAVSDVEVLLEKKNQNGNLGEIARLNKVRNIITGETQIGDKLNESRIKTITSGIEPIVARFLYGNEFEFTPIFKIFMATNHKPVIRGTDHGIWRRIKILPFNVIFDEDKQDKDLLNKLTAELPEILNWAIQGCLLWQSEGLKNPITIDESIKDYRSEMDLVQRWIDESCEIGPMFRERSADLFKNLCDYTMVNKEFQISNTLFGRNLSKKFEKRLISGVTYYLGIRLKVDTKMASANKKKYEDI